MALPDSRSSLQHILAAPEEPPADATPAPPTSNPMPPPTGSQQYEQRDDAASNADDGQAAEQGTGDEPVYTSTTTSTRRNASGSVSSVYSGNKIRHLKKEDGIPLWRKDIQYDFLSLVFYDKTKCFTKHSDGTTGFTFAEVYVDAMAKSSKCSKILKEKLLQDTDGAISMAMVCLLVNVGRMNTTLNFFPEMRAQLRTYHSIPALQAHQDPNAYKQLQDAPRLKSILKGATEDDPQPSTMEEVKNTPRPRTNPVNLIFVLAQFAPKISETHFVPPRDFYDLVMRGSLSSASRARAFLWLIWWYLESDFTFEDTKRNPFGPGQYGEEEEGTEAMPVKVPPLESLTEEQAALENVDTNDEELFGEVKRKERIAILASEPSPAMTALKRARKEKGLATGGPGYRSDDEGSEAGWWKSGEPKSHVTSAARAHGVSFENDSTHTKSPSPALGRGFQAVNSASKAPQDMRINTLLNNDDQPPEQPLHSPPFVAPALVKKGPGRGNWRRNKNKDQNATSGGGRSGSGEGTHHVPLLPNNGSMGFVNETPQGAHIAPATPGSGPYSQYSNTVGAFGSPHRSSGIAFQGPNARDHIPTPSYQAQKRSRGVTQHQSALISHRKQQIDYTLDRRIRKVHIHAREAREQEGSIFRAWKRIKLMPTDYDSEEEAIRIRKARDKSDRDDDWRRNKETQQPGDEVDWRRPKALLAGFQHMDPEPSDLGEESRAMAKMLRQASRRLERWQEASMPGQAVIRSRQRQAQGLLDIRRRSASGRDRSSEHEGEDEEEERVETGKRSLQRQRSDNVRASTGRGENGSARAQNGHVAGDEGGGELDDEDREMLGEVDADESEQDDEDQEMADD